MTQKSFSLKKIKKNYCIFHLKELYLISWSEMIQTFKQGKVNMKNNNSKYENRCPFCAQA